MSMLFSDWVLYGTSVHHWAGEVNDYPWWYVQALPLDWLLFAETGSLLNPHPLATLRGLFEKAGWLKTVHWTHVEVSDIQMALSKGVTYFMSTAHCFQTALFIM